MKYLLVILTHGDHEQELATSVGAFLHRVRPLPEAGYLAIDGPLAPVLDSRVEAVRRACGPYSPRPWLIAPRERQAGFCTATREAWAVAAQGDHDYVLWLEHDFEITRPVDVQRLAAVLDATPKLAQMALMRNAVNEEERAAGGLFESRRAQYELRHTCVDREVEDWHCDARIETHSFAPWLEHRAYLTTNPCLMRRDFMEAHPWPDYTEQCEGRFGLDLVAEGFTFGVWGTGEPWCRHIGERTGFGY